MIGYSDDVAALVTTLTVEQVQHTLEMVMR